MEKFNVSKGMEVCILIDIAFGEGGLRTDSHVVRGIANWLEIASTKSTIGTFFKLQLRLGCGAEAVIIDKK